MVELNVRDQMLNLAKTSFVQRRWSEGEFPVLHAWVYHLEDGRLVEVQGTAEGAPFTRTELDDLLRLGAAGAEALFELQKAAP